MRAYCWLKVVFSISFFFFLIDWKNPEYHSSKKEEDKKIALFSFDSTIKNVCKHLVPRRCSFCFSSFISKTTRANAKQTLQKSIKCFFSKSLCWLCDGLIHYRLPTLPRRQSAKKMQLLLIRPFFLTLFIFGLLLTVNVSANDDCDDINENVQDLSGKVLRVSVAQVSLFTFYNFVCISEFFFIDFIL